MDCAGARGLRFPALPVKPEPETVFLMRDPLMAILPEDHPLQDLEAILSMAESGLGVSVLPQLVLRRIPYRAAIRPLFFSLIVILCRRCAAKRASLLR